jgi:hypothetical protein
MNRLTRPVYRLGCLVSIVAPLIGIALYPRANWLFAFVLVGIAAVLLKGLTKKDPTPQELADHAERLLSGNSRKWDVDDYEHLNPKEPSLNDLWSRTMAVGGLPEEWARLDERKKSELREIIETLKEIKITTR